jgi:predicted anti-sigma-YlaC factor YlaD
MIARAPHLQDERLFDCYYAERRGDAPDPPIAEHLTDCDACRHRFYELSQFLSALRTEADAELEAAFPPERIRAQQQEIARRLESVGRAARVISFPGRVAAQQANTSTARMATRWIAAAAAAGLFVGVAAGTAFNFGGRLDFGRSARFNVGQTARQRISSSVPAVLAPAVASVSTAADDAFMSDLESALDRPHTSELVVFDALTPHVREIVDIRDIAR